MQLAGHQGNFRAGPEPGTILKKLCPKEQMCFQVLMKDALKPFVPEYKGYITTDDGERKYWLNLLKCKMEKDEWYQFCIWIRTWFCFKI